MQIEYSLIERTAEGELLPMATELGIGVMPYSPLRGGRLSGKYKRDGNIPDSARAVILDRPTAEEWTVIDAVTDVAAELDVTPAQVALAWVTGRNAVTSTIIGARTQEQLRSNLASLAITLTPQQRHTLDAASSPTLDYPAWVNAGPGPQMGFGGSTVDDVQRPTWGTLTNSAIRY
jgi:aryl-alcohol dehydrogenase-like predicted oxidoreductase